MQPGAPHLQQRDNRRIETRPTGRTWFSAVIFCSSRFRRSRFRLWVYFAASHSLSRVFLPCMISDIFVSRIRLSCSIRAYRSAPPAYNAYKIGHTAGHTIRHSGSGATAAAPARNGRRRHKRHANNYKFGRVTTTTAIRPRTLIHLLLLQVAFHVLELWRRLVVNRRLHGPHLLPAAGSADKAAPHNHTPLSRRRRAGQTHQRRLPCTPRAALHSSSYALVDLGAHFQLLLKQQLAGLGLRFACEVHAAGLNGTVHQVSRRTTGVQV